MKGVWTLDARFFLCDGCGLDRSDIYVNSSCLVVATSASIVACGHARRVATAHLHDKGCWYAVPSMHRQVFWCLLCVIRQLQQLDHDHHHRNNNCSSSSLLQTARNPNLNHQRTATQTDSLVPNGELFHVRRPGASLQELQLRDVGAQDGPANLRLHLHNHLLLLLFLRRVRGDPRSFWRFFSPSVFAPISSPRPADPSILRCAAAHSLRHRHDGWALGEGHDNCGLRQERGLEPQQLTTSANTRDEPSRRQKIHLCSHVFTYNGNGGEIHGYHKNWRPSTTLQRCNEQQICETLPSTSLPRTWMRRRRGRYLPFRRRGAQGEDPRP